MSSPPIASAPPGPARAPGSRALLSLLYAVFALSGCTWAIADKPMEGAWTPAINEPWVEQIPDGRSDELLVFLAFSGGGTRAAAFAYGALKELSETEIELGGKRRRLVDEVDVISSVSGGSFSAAYYGLYGDRIFRDFEADFLRRDVEGELIARLFWPPNWFRLASGTYGRSDLAAAYYDEILFEGATFRDFLRPTAPALVINATDLATGSRFGFTQLYFDLLCADLKRYPVSRAVAASSAVPVLLSPITLRNYTPQCDYRPPAWLEQALHNPEDPRRRAEARDLLSYEDPEKRRYVHLVDGGIADNLGLRGAFQLVSLQDDTEETFRYIGHPHPRVILFILVDAETHRGVTHAGRARRPGHLGPDRPLQLRDHRTREQRLRGLGGRPFVRPTTRPVRVRRSELRGRTRRGGASRPERHRNELRAGRRRRRPSDPRVAYRIARLRSLPGGADDDRRSKP